MSVTRTNVTSCDAPGVFRLGVSVKHVPDAMEDSKLPCNAIKAATAFQTRFLLGWVLTPKAIAAQATAPNPIAR